MRIVLSLIVLIATAQAFAESGKLVIHEWGTFTSFQDESGRGLPGINADDEALPPFVESIPISYEQSSKFSKAIPRLHPQVTMRLETPVVYFYPPADAKLPITLTFSAKFHAGLLTQFFPKADVSAIARQANQVVTIDPKSAGTLTWKDVSIGGDGSLIPTKERVWTAPREVQSAMLTTADGKSEKFLFYRGVGNLNAPLMVTHEKDSVHVKLSPEMNERSDCWPDVESMYLVQIRADGTNAFHRFRQGDGINLKPNVSTALFKKTEFGNNLDALRNQMHDSLVIAGLKADEATAMLNTWEQSYFKSPGMRLFFLVPQAWTDAVLPITVSEPAEITRVMVGRIEIVTPQQREAIQKIAGTKSGKDPDALAAYQGLGRFRDALLLDAVKQTPQLESFLKEHGIAFATMGQQPVAMRESTVPRGASPAAK
ncbi:MAG TPA: hypothetical protein VL282_01640 [Tepidisphaeraceae bacterium]|jgi:hypothetical protein|nr:hypothetical protein [Tepidisphaeraceae bacterium]